MGPDSTATQ